MAERVTWVVDRIEGDFAVVEVDAGHTIQLPLAWLPDGSGEGTHLRVMHEPAPGASTLILKIEPRGSLRDGSSRATPGRGDPGGNVNL